MAMARRIERTAPVSTGFAAPLAARMSIPWLVRTGLCFAFLAAFLQYEVSISITQLLPLAALAFCGLLVLSGRHRAARLQHILSGGALWFGAVLFAEVVSYTSHDTYSELYGLVFIGVFLCARLIVQEIGIPNVMRAYSQAGILTACVMLITGRQTLFASGGRFAGGTRAHPNLVSFVMAGFFPVIIWRAMEERVRWRKRVLIGLSIATFGLIFLTGSRGSLSAVLIAAGAMLVRAVGSGWLRKIRIGHLHIMAALILIPLATAFLLQHNRIGNIASFLNDFLSLNSTQRGVKSGLSGRTGIWNLAFGILRSHNRWLFGFGYRAGDRLVGTIDNGYVQLLFESGLIAGLMILSSMLRVFLLLWRVSRPIENNAWTRYYMMLWCLMVVYFLNNISTRYLFSFGSPFSLCVLCLMAASRRELIGGGMREPVIQQVKPSPPAATTEALAWNRYGR
jgi:O-antigen ligase